MYVYLGTSSIVYQYKHGESAKGDSINERREWMDTPNHSPARVTTTTAVKVCALTAWVIDEENVVQTSTAKSARFSKDGKC